MLKQYVENCHVTLLFWNKMLEAATSFLKPGHRQRSASPNQLNKTLGKILSKILVEDKKIENFVQHATTKASFLQWLIQTSSWQE